MKPKKFNKWRQALANELIAAYTRYHIMKQLWPSDGSVQVLNQYWGFFHYTIAAQTAILLQLLIFSHEFVASMSVQHE